MMKISEVKKMLTRWNKLRQKRQEEDARAAETADFLREALHDDEVIGLDQLLERIKALPPDSEEDVGKPNLFASLHVGYHTKLMTAISAAVILLGILAGILSVSLKPARTVWVSMIPKVVWIRGGDMAQVFFDRFLDVDQAVGSRSDYPAGISARLALRLSIVGDAEGVFFCVEYTVKRGDRWDHGYAALARDEIIAMAEEGYSFRDIYVHR
jgi:hypothetical protein